MVKKFVTCISFLCLKRGGKETAKLKKSKAVPTAYETRKEGSASQNPRGPCLCPQTSSILCDVPARGALSAGAPVRGQSHTAHETARPARLLLPLPRVYREHELLPRCGRPQWCGANFFGHQALKEPVGKACQPHYLKEVEAEGAKEHPVRHPSLPQERPQTQIAAHSPPLGVALTHPASRKLGSLPLDHREPQGSPAPAGGRAAFPLPRGRHSFSGNAPILPRKS